MNDSDLIARASGFHPWDAMAPPALSGILRRGPFRSSVETGCGGSTIVLSHASDRHVAFAIEGKDRTITDLRKQSDLRSENVIFVEGETKDTLPGYQFEGEVDLSPCGAEPWFDGAWQTEEALPLAGRHREQLDGVAGASDSEHLSVRPEEPGYRVVGEAGLPLIVE